MAKEGFYEIYAKKDSYPLQATSKLQSGGKARTALSKVLDFACDKGKIRRDEMNGGLVLSDTKLSKWTEKHVKRCVQISGIEMPEVPGDGTSAIEGSVCFVRQGESWIVGAAGLWDLGHGLESNMEEGTKKIVKKAVAEWGS